MHAGSLARPPDLREMVLAKSNGQPMTQQPWPGAYAAPSQKSCSSRLPSVLTASTTVNSAEEYEWLARHLLRKVAKPPAPPDRERSLTAQEQTRLLAACQVSRNAQLYVATVLALCTATRKRIAAAAVARYRPGARLAQYPPVEKRRAPGDPLVPQALTLLRQQAQEARSLWVFPRADGRKPVYLDYAWRQACARAGLADFHFHDLRHTSASYLAMSGASLRDMRRDPRA